MIIVGSFLPEPFGWLVPPSLLGHRSRRCHGINSTHRPCQSRCRRARGVPLIMDETYLQYPGSGPADRSIAANALLREEPDEEEDDEKEHDGDEEDDDGDEGYS